MQSFRGSIRLIQRHALTSSNTCSIPNGVVSTKSVGHSFHSLNNYLSRSLHLLATRSQVPILWLLCLSFHFSFFLWGWGGRRLFSLDLILVQWKVYTEEGCCVSSKNIGNSYKLSVLDDSFLFFNILSLGFKEKGKKKLFDTCGDSLAGKIWLSNRVFGFFGLLH